MIMTHGDRHVFALWYHLHALGARRDVVVVSTSLLQFDWYPEVLRSAHPDLVPARLPRSYRDRVLTLVDHAMARRSVYSVGGDPLLAGAYRASGGDDLRRLEPRER